MKTDDVLDAIDAACADWEVGPDAVRFNADPDETARAQWHMNPVLPVVPVTRFTSPDSDLVDIQDLINRSIAEIAARLPVHAFTIDLHGGIGSMRVAAAIDPAPARDEEVVVWVARVGADGQPGEWTQIGTLDTRGLDISHYSGDDLARRWIDCAIEPAQRITFEQVGEG